MRPLPWLISCLFVLPALGEDWTRFRGPDASGVSSQRVPTTWSDSENLAWRTELPGKGSSSPVVHQGRIYLTAYSGYGLDAEQPGNREDLLLHVVCLDLESGKIRWDRTVEPDEREQEITNRIADHGYASPTPCVDDSGVYASFGPSAVVAFTLHNSNFSR